MYRNIPSSLPHPSDFLNKRTMNTQLVVLDMAGTTVRDDDAVNRCLQEALAQAQCPVTREQVNEVMGLPKPVAIEKLLRRNLSPAAATPRIVEVVHSDFLQRMIQYYETDPRVEPMPHAQEVIESLKKAGIKVALDTGFSRPIIQAILNRLAWTNGFLDATVASDEVARGRPHPDLIHEAMRLTQIADPALVAKVGDTPSDLREGSAAGCRWVVGVTNGSHTEKELLPHPHTHLIPNLSHLSAILNLS